MSDFVSIAKAALIRLYIDHDHESGKIRGLLCQQCNCGLGNFKENLEFLNSACNYLRKYNETKENNTSL